MALSGDVELILVTSHNTPSRAKRSSYAFYEAAQ